MTCILINILGVYKDTIEQQPYSLIAIDHARRLLIMNCLNNAFHGKSQVALRFVRDICRRWRWYNPRFNTRLSCPNLWHELWPYQCRHFEGQVVWYRHHIAPRTAYSVNLTLNMVTIRLTVWSDTFFRLRMVLLLLLLWVNCFQEQKFHLADW